MKLEMSLVVLALCGVISSSSTNKGTTKGTTKDTGSLGSKGRCSFHPFTAQTSNGRIKGHTAPNTPRVVEYLGIPYAAAPTGALRFTEPRPYQAHGPQDASSFGARCPQTPSRPVHYPNDTPQSQMIIRLFGGQSDYNTSEDCLTLNIWTRRTSRACRAAKPILIFFYGGRFSIGDTISPFYNGAELAASEDVVVVTVNYRINIFGFPGAPESRKNLAFLDQRQAVEWVSKNAAAFGGDARKITILGQSSGSVAVDYYSYTYIDDPLVAGFISHSGNVFSFPTSSSDLAAKNWYNVSQQLGCGGSGETLGCMRSKSFQEILVAVSKIRPPPLSSRTRTQPAFQPTIDGRTVLTAEEYSSRLKAGRVSKKPYLFINNDNEAGYYKVPAFGQGTVLPESDWTDFNAQSFTCPNTYEVFYRARYGVPVWLARYFGDWENVRLYPTSGAYHGSDLNMLFGNSEVISGLPESSRESKMKKMVQKAWAAFAEDPERGLSRLGWPKYDRKRPTLIQLATNNTSTFLYKDPKAFDSVCNNLNLTFYDID